MDVVWAEPSRPLPIFFAQHSALLLSIFPSAERVVTNQKYSEPNTGHRFRSSRETGL